MTRMSFALVVAMTGGAGSPTREEARAVSVSSVNVPSAHRPPVEALGAIQAEMRHVDFHIDSGIVLHIQSLRGTLLPTSAGKIATLDDKGSFSLSIHAAEIAIDTASLATLLNRHVFGYRGSPLRKLRVHTEGSELVQTGVMHKGVNIPFRIHATVGLTPDGRIRIHPTSVKMLGMGVTNAMRFFGLQLSGIVKLQPGHGASIEGNDIIHDAMAILPPPRLRGRLTGIAVAPGTIRQTFSPTGAEEVSPLRAAGSGVPNYMFFRGGTLRFGKLTMENADLLIVDSDSSNVFDFSLDRYNDQLVGGGSRNTRDHGLIVVMPDFAKLGHRGG